jgi:UDP-N-acetylmuramyl pentapeptide synthase
MSEPGEIRALAEIAEPAVRVITTVSAGHLEFFDSVEGIADAKGELFEGAGAGDTLVMPAGEWFSERLPLPEGADVLTFTSRSGVSADLRLLECRDRGLDGTWGRLDLAGQDVEIELPVAGFHQLHNALAAAGAALAMGSNVEDIQSGLARVELPGRRMRIERVGDVTVVDDAYNANPASVAAALASLENARPGSRRVAVLGDMLELGPSAKELHAEVGRALGRHGVALLIGAGPLMAHAVEAAVSVGVEALSVADSTAAGEILHDRIRPDDVILFKGSRGMKMELAIEAIRPSGYEGS